MSDADIPVRLVAIRHAAEGTHLYEFAALDGGTLPPFEPGAHIDVCLPNGLTRQYSLCNSVHENDRYVVGVKLDRNSRGGSRYMHESLRVGATLSVSAPRNHFALVSDAPAYVFIAGGVGITPIACMISRLSSLGQPWTLHYAVRTRAEAAFLDQLQGPGLHLHVDTEHNGEVLDVNLAVASAPRDAHLYCCGPTPMLDAFEQACADRAPEFVHLERFSSDVAPAVEGGYTVELTRSKRSVEIAPGQTILDAVRACGVNVRASCQQGVCGACETRVVAGLPDHRDTLLSPEERAANDVMMICCSGSLTKVLALDL